RTIPAAFGIFGHGNACGLGEALSAHIDELPFLAPKHEQAMVHTALGYAKATRRLATLACTASIGPGATNLVTGAATATTNRLPVLLLPGDTFASRLQGPVLQQLQHPASADWTVNDTLRPVSRFFDRISRPEQLLDALPAAMRVLIDPADTGAVTVCLHQDVQGEPWDFPETFFAPRVWRIDRRPPDERRLLGAADVLRDACAPLAIVGGGVRYSGAEEALTQLADRHGVPVAETSAAKGTARAELALGGIGVNGSGAANAIAAEADVILCAGTRLSDFTTGSRSLFAEGARFIGLNVAAADAHHLGALPLVADARAGLTALDRALGDWVTTAAYRGRVRSARGEWHARVERDLEPRPGERMSQGQALETVNGAARAGDWVVAAAGSPPGDLLTLWDAPEGSFAHLEFAFSCMGHEIPAALGIRMAEGAGGEILVVVGDGTYLMAPTELVTAARHGLKVTVVLLVNGGYQSIHALQRTTLGTGFGTEFDGEAVDYAANARSLGCAVWEADTPQELSAALDNARAQDRPAVVACRVEPHRMLLGSDAWWELGVPLVSDSPAAVALAATHREGAARQRFHG
ncbi:MAG TPA: thiamine pyrophosphate-dependent enzyme, partial [Solirubrobacteraceae bacterium]|nr:thiamine pyrophosphate-dependent enzyme [Solirubrobacteraceae bacterium]